MRRKNNVRLCALFPWIAFSVLFLTSPGCGDDPSPEPLTEEALQEVERRDQEVMQQESDL